MKSKLPFILSGIFAALFILLLILLLTVDGANIAPEGGRVGLSSLNQAVRDTIGGPHMMLYKIAKWTGYFALLSAAGFALLGLVQLIKRRSLAKVDRELIFLAVLYAASALFYILFEIFAVNVRPFILPGELKPETSFPSSHTLLAITFFGGAALLCHRYLQKKALCLCVQVGLILLLLATTLCRFLSGVHWLTDILGGIFLGCALLFAYLGALRMPDERDAQKKNEV